MGELSGDAASSSCDQMFVNIYQIVVLNKTKERLRPYQNIQEEEDPDIKKIKKVRRLRGTVKTTITNDKINRNKQIHLSFL